MSRPKSSPTAAAYCGITTWLVYGVIELGCLAIVPWFLKAGYEYKAYDARFNAILLLIYAAIGGVVGLGSGFVSRWAWWRDREQGQVFTALNTAAISAVLLLNTLILWRDWVFAPIILVVNLILVILASLASTGEGEWARRCRRFSAPWLPCAAYLVPLSMAGWLGLASGARIEVYTALWMMALWAAAWILGGRQVGLTGIAAAGIVCCGVTAVLHATPYRESAAVRAPAAGSPNVILISLDTVRADHLSVYGYGKKTSPHLEEFAKESVLFTRALSSGDMTLPSHASLFTGMYPSQHGAHFSPNHRLGVPLDKRFETLAGDLRDHGYWTGGVIANGGYLSVGFGLNRGFSYWDQRLPAVILAPLPSPYLRGRIRNLVVHFVATSEWDRVSRSAEEINQAALAALGQRTQDGRPFFLFLNYMDAHIPYIPPEPYKDRFPGRDPGFTEARYIAAYLDVMAHDHKLDERDRAHLVSQYDGGIAYLDAQLGALFARLKADGLYQNSLIIVTADHGEALGERDCLDHGGLSLYEDQIHVPLLIRYPGGARKGVVGAAAAGVDIMPTVLEAAGIAIPKHLAGQSLSAPLAEGREVLAESFPGGRAYFTNNARFDRTYRGISSASMKYIASSAGSPELYDIRQDPAESRNLFNPEEARSRQAAEQLSAWSRLVTQKGPGQKAGKTDRETLERLRNLGYVSK